MFASQSSSQIGLVQWVILWENKKTEDQLNKQLKIPRETNLWAEE